MVSGQSASRPNLSRGPRSALRALSYRMRARSFSVAGKVVFGRLTITRTPTDEGDILLFLFIAYRNRLFLALRAWDSHYNEFQAVSRKRSNIIGEQDVTANKLGIVGLLPNLIDHLISIGNAHKSEFMRRAILMNAQHNLAALGIRERRIGFPYIQGQPASSFFELKMLGLFQFKLSVQK